MTTADLDRIEAELSVSLPAAYRTVMLDHPLPPDSFGAEFMLPDDAETLIELNRAGVVLDGVAAPFFIGSDGGEEWYFVDLSAPASGVFMHRLETGGHERLDADLDGYLARIRAMEAEMAAEEQAAAERRGTRKWWEFWK